MDLRGYEIRHWQNIAAYLRGTKRAFFKSADRIAKIYERVPPDQSFVLSNFPEIKQAVENELRMLAKEVNGVVVNGINNEWILANMKNDAMVAAVTGGRVLPAKVTERWMGRNLDALSAFTKRTEGGMGLSDRVWNLVRQNAIGIEQHMALGVKEGTPAARLATEMKQYLNEPDKLFRRVRDAAGDLQLSKAASEYHPGQGVYRSSYKNALRLTRTETNMAYQKADAERQKDLNFVLGIEVRRSNVPYDCEICDAGAGEYPKDYEWTLWHPNCRCVSVPVLPDIDEIVNVIETADDPTTHQYDGQVTEMPEKWVRFREEHPKYTHFGHE